MLRKALKSAERIVPFVVETHDALRGLGPETLKSLTRRFDGQRRNATRTPAQDANCFRGRPRQSGGLGQEQC
jgi:hypothetical protein